MYIDIPLRSGWRVEIEGGMPFFASKKTLRMWAYQSPAKVDFSVSKQQLEQPVVWPSAKLAGGLNMVHIDSWRIMAQPPRRCEFLRSISNIKKDKNKTSLHLTYHTWLYVHQVQYPRNGSSKVKTYRAYWENAGYRLPSVTASPPPKENMVSVKLPLQSIDLDELHRLVTVDMCKCWLYSERDYPEEASFRLGEFEYQPYQQSNGL